MTDEIKKLLLIAYAIAKDIVKFQSENVILMIVKIVMRVALAIYLLVLYYLIITPFILWHRVLGIILKFIYGEFYGGLLNGRDTIFEVQPNKTVINVVLIFSYTKSPLDLILKLKQRALELHHSSYKLSSRIKHIFGYYYYLKNQVEFDHVTETLRYNNEEFMTKDNLLDYLEENCITISENRTWKAVFFSQSIRWTTGSAKKQIAVVLTFRHAVGDYPSVIGFIKKYFRLTEKHFKPVMPFASNNKENSFIEKLDKTHVVKNPLKLPFTGKRNMCRDANCYITVFSEERPNYVAKIKEIKRKIDSSFVGVFSTAISTTIGQYYKQKNVNLENIVMGIVVRSVQEDIPKIVNRTFNFKQLINNSSGYFLDFAFESKKDMKARLEESKHIKESIKNAVDPYLLYLFGGRLSTYLPGPFIYFLSKPFANNINGGISNVVGLSESTCCDSPIDDIFFFAPNMFCIGFLFFIYTYNDRVQMTAVANKEIVNSREELQEVVNNIFKNIDEAAEEVL